MPEKKKAISKKIVKLDKRRKKVVAKVGVDYGHSYREIGRLLGLSKDTIGRYAKEEIPSDLRQFETQVKDLFTEQKFVLSARCIARLQELVPRERRISEVVKAAEYAEGISKGGDVTVPIQFNINEDREKFK